MTSGHFLLKITVDLFCNFFSAAVGNLGINVLRHTHIRVAKELLRILNVNISFMKQRRVAVPKLMRGQVNSRFVPPKLPRFVEKIFFHQFTFVSAEQQIVFSSDREKIDQIIGNYDPSNPRRGFRLFQMRIVAFVIDRFCDM